MPPKPSRLLHFTTHLIPASSLSRSRPFSNFDRRVEWAGNDRKRTCRSMISIPSSLLLTGHHVREQAAATVATLRPDPLRHASSLACCLSSVCILHAQPRKFVTGANSPLCACLPNTTMQSPYQIAPAINPHTARAIHAICVHKTKQTTHSKEHNPPERNGRNHSDRCCLSSCCSPVGCPIPSTLQ